MTRINLPTSKMIFDNFPPLAEEVKQSLINVFENNKEQIMNFVENNNDCNLDISLRIKRKE